MKKGVRCVLTNSLKNIYIFLQFQDLLDNLVKWFWSSVTVIRVKMTLSVLLWMILTNVFVFPTTMARNVNTNTMTAFYHHCQSKNWYFVTKIVLTYCEKNWSSDREKCLKYEAEGQEFAKVLRSLEQFVQTVKGQNNFW